MVEGADGNWGILTIGENTIRPVPGLEANYYVTSWTPDGSALYVASNMDTETTAKVYRVHPKTGKLQFWKNFGEGLPAGGIGAGGLRLSRDGSVYAYTYGQILSEAYVVRGLK